MAAAMKSFEGYLIGTQKSAHTIGSYRSDLTTFQKFLQEGLGEREVGLHELRDADLVRYHEYLRALHLKTNTRRRKLLTIRKFLRYLSGRQKISIELGTTLPAPMKIERIAKQVDYASLREAVLKLPVDSSILARNRALLWTLLETGCQVSEVTRIRLEDVGSEWIQITGKAERRVPVTDELTAFLRAYGQRHGIRTSKTPQGPVWLFFGFNKYGPLKTPVTPRGVELLVRVHAKRLGLPGVTPRLFRRAAVLHWFQSGLSQENLRERLGLKTDYAFKAYAPLFKRLKSSSKTTSTDETSRPE